MLKLVVESYKNQIKSGFKNLWAQGWMIYIYMLAIPPILFDIESHVLLYYCVMIPQLLGLMLSRMYPNQMSKTLLLCPLSVEERKAYVKTGFAFRCILPIGLFAIVNGCLVLAGILPILHFLGMLFIQIFYAMSVNVYRLPIQRENTRHKTTYDFNGMAGNFNTMQRKYDLPGNYEVWNVIVQLLGLIGSVMFITDVPDIGAIYAIEESRTFDVVMLTIMVVLLFLVWLKIMKTYYKPVVEQAIGIEEIITNPGKAG